MAMLKEIEVRRLKENAQFALNENGNDASVSGTLTRNALRAKIEAYRLVLKE